MYIAQASSLHSVRHRKPRETGASARANAWALTSALSLVSARESADQQTLAFATPFPACAVLCCPAYDESTPH